MNKNFIALTKSEQRQITGGSWLSKAWNWLKTHCFSWTTEPRYPGEPFVETGGGIGVTF